MASTFSFAETYGVSSGGDCTKVNFLSTNTASGTDTTTNTLAAPITIEGSDNYSYERWIRGHWTGTFNGISNIRVWASTSGPGTGVTIQGNVKTPNPTTYVTAVDTDSTFATTNIPTVQGSGLQPTYNSGSTGTPATTQCSDYVVLQMTVANTASPGYVTAVTFNYGWDET